MHPILAIVGRPNVGKSRLFNRIVGKGKAIVADIPGVTRDRHYSLADWLGREFIVVDTGGLELDPDADLGRSITEQSLKAIDEADVIVCLFDGQIEPVVKDREVVDALRKSSKCVIFVVNKIDEDVHERRVDAFYELGITKLFSVSAEHGRGVDDILDEAVADFPPDCKKEEKDEDRLAVAVVGRPNVGKSTLINRICGTKRVVAHELAGTTRDAIDVEIDIEGKKYLFIDTAGVKRRWGVSERLEKFTALRSLRTVGRADIVLQLIDASDGLTKQDISLTDFIRGEGKGSILLVNKWDLMDASWEEYEIRLRRGLGDLKNLAIIPVSAKTGKNCLKILSAADSLSRALGTKLTTSALNRIIEAAIEGHHMPVYKGKEVKIYYATQTGTNPPTFTLFSNYPEAVPYTYRKYLTNRILDAMGEKGIPVRIVCRKK